MDEEQKEETERHLDELIEDLNNFAPAPKKGSRIAVFKKKIDEEQVQDRKRVDEIEEKEREREKEREDVRLVEGLVRRRTEQLTSPRREEEEEPVPRMRSPRKSPPSQSQSTRKSPLRSEPSRISPSPRDSNNEAKVLKPVILPPRLLLVCMAVALLMFLMARFGYVFPSIWLIPPFLAKLEVARFFGIDILSFSLSHLTGLSAVLLGAGILHRATKVMEKQDTCHYFEKGVRNLIVRDVYAFSRNPMYCALMIGIAGLSIAFNSIYFLAMGSIFVLYIVLYVVPMEEAFLEELFPEKYPRYKRDVPRWFGLNKLFLN